MLPVRASVVTKIKNTSGERTLCALWRCSGFGSVEWYCIQSSKCKKKTLPLCGAYPIVGFLSTVSLYHFYLLTYFWEALGKCD